METKIMSLANMQGKLTRMEMKQIIAGRANDEDGRCLGCKTDRECAQVNKGKCDKECPGKDHKGCSDW